MSGSEIFGPLLRAGLVDLDQIFLHHKNIYKIYILQKKWSKSTNPALSSGPNISLPLIWGSHHQLDDQYKEPMNNTEII